ncbi:hypothetical protein BS47DRAFT_1447776 [Hydnum rufescens UP504]|uniref:Uncharacterized protein n=1 Tax=Hydnum rufescens UP504 TaxID=1448309 RepID=A0A9P6AEZ7_9AGAM|nr:hypothetical protein BS47DRAFT_1447776 [Hydnum rufescens UP504]
MKIEDAHDRRPQTLRPEIPHQYQTEPSFTWSPLYTFVDGIVTGIGSSLHRRIVLRLRELLFGRLFLVRSTEANEF